MQPISDSISFDDLVPVESKYLTKNDVGEDGVILTIRGFKRETLKSDEGDEEKTVMYFEEADYKPMILNRTNAQLLPIITGAANAGQARGRQIVVYNDPTVGFGGRITGGVRLKKIPGPPKAASHPDAF